MSLKYLKKTAVAVATAALFIGCAEEKPKADIGRLANEAKDAVAESGIDLKKFEGSTLHIYTWSDYISPDVIEGFEKELNVKVKIDTFDSNEAMYAKLKAGGGAGYDIIMPSSYMVATMAKEGLIIELDHSKIPNVKKNFDHAGFSSQILDPSFKYNAPYAVTYGGFMYLKDKIPAGVDVNSWSVLENANLRGKITLLDDMREVIGAGLMYKGYSINSKDPAQINEAVEQILKWKNNVRKFDAESYKTEVASKSIWLGHGYSTDATQVILGEDEGSARPDIGFALPKEGFSIACDEMVISATAPNRDLAYAFINYIYKAYPAKVNMEYIMGPMPVKPGIDALDEAYRNQIVLSADLIKKGQPIAPVDDVMELYNNAWDRIKATK